MTARDFFDDRGGLTLEEWLKELVFPDHRDFNDYLKTKVVDSESESDYRKVIDKMRPGTLFFEYNGFVW